MGNYKDVNRIIAPAILAKARWVLIGVLPALLFGGCDEDRIYLNKKKPEDTGVPPVVGTGGGEDTGGGDTGPDSSCEVTPLPEGPIHCYSGVTDGDEEGTDCGGSCATACPIRTPTGLCGGNPGECWLGCSESFAYRDDCAIPSRDIDECDSALTVTGILQCLQVFYRVPVEDTCTCALTPTVGVSDGFSVCAFVECPEQTATVTCGAGATPESNAYGEMIGCCGTEVSFDYTCGRSDRSAVIVLEVVPDSEETCREYTLTYGF